MTHIGILQLRCRLSLQALLGRFYAKVGHSSRSTISTRYGTVTICKGAPRPVVAKAPKAPVQEVLHGSQWQIHMQLLVALNTKYGSQILESFNWLQICKLLRTESTESNDMIKVNIKSKGREPFTCIIWYMHLSEVNLWPADTEDPPRGDAFRMLLDSWRSPRTRWHHGNFKSEHFTLADFEDCWYLHGTGFPD